VLVKTEWWKVFGEAGHATGLEFIVGICAFHITFLVFSICV